MVTKVERRSNGWPGKRRPGRPHRLQEFDGELSRPTTYSEWVLGEVPLGRAQGVVTEDELDVLQRYPASVENAGEGADEIVGSQGIESNRVAVAVDDASDEFPVSGGRPVLNWLVVPIGRLTNSSYHEPLLATPGDASSRCSTPTSAPRENHMKRRPDRRSDVTRGPIAVPASWHQIVAG